MVVSRPLVVYDGSRPAFRRAMGAFTRGTDLRPVPWDAPRVQAFLTAQFDDQPFAFLLVEGDRVHAGGETVARVLRRRSVAAPLAALVERAYPAVADPVGRAVHGREPADLSGTFDLDERAAAHLDPLRRTVEVPVTAD